MPLGYDEDQRAFISVVTEALERSCPMSLVREVGEKHAERWREVWARLVEIGLVALLVPESAGGLDLTPVEMVAVLEAAGHFAAPVPLTTTMGAFVPLVVEAGRTDNAAIALLTEVVAGAAGTLAPSVGAVLDGGKLTVRCDGIPEPTRAARIAIPAQAGDGRVVLVVGSTDDLALRSDAGMDPSSSVGTLELADHDIGGSVVLEGDPRPALPIVWTAAAAELVGLGAELVDRSVAHACDREQFSKPIGSFQAVKHLLVDTHLAVERARSLTLYAAVLARDHDERTAVAAHNAKAAASEAATAAARAAVQVHGGSGITKEQDVGLLYLRARQLSQLLGGPDFHYACASAAWSAH